MDPIPGLDLAQIGTWTTGFVVLTLRVGAFLVASPVYGGRFVPLPVRIIAAVVLTVPLLGRVPVPPVEVVASLQAIPLILGELMIGLTAGMVMTILFGTASLAGDRIASTAGLSFAAQFDPGAGGQTPVVAQFFGMGLLMVFLGADGHLSALRLILDSYVTIPPGATINPAALIATGISAGGQMFMLGAKMMLPVVATLLLVNIAIGILTRSAPTLNVFSFGFPLTMSAAILLLWLTAPGAVAMMDQLVDLTLNVVAKMLEDARV